MSTGATVDPKSLHFQFGPHKLKQGRAKGDSLQVQYLSDAYVPNAGIDEEAFWAANDDLSANIVLTLLQTASFNDILSRLHIADRSTPGGLLLPLILSEKNGTTKYAAARARVIKFADGVWSDGGAVRQWTFSTLRLVGFVGGVSATPINPNP